MDVVAGGIANVLVKFGRGVTSPKRSCAPTKGRAGGQRGAKPYWGGLFFLYPKTGRAIQTAPMYHPVNNDFAIDELGKALERYPRVNSFIYDRACEVKESVLQRAQNYRR